MIARAGLGAGDSALWEGVAPEDDWFAAVRDEVDWGPMNHRGSRVPRDVAIQATFGQDGAHPIYRHPVDDEPPVRPWTPAVDRLRARVEAAVGQPLNHAMVQRYPGRLHNISLHADKTLDISRGTAVVNLSLGATRTLLLQHKDRLPNGGFATTQVELAHGSLFVLGWETNRAFRHGIRPDRRPDRLLRPAERREGGARISLTFRTIATFRVPDGRLTGQGARRDGEPRDERRELLAAFGEENTDSCFDWERWYGRGFDRITLRR